VHFTLEQPSP